MQDREKGDFGLKKILIVGAGEAGRMVAAEVADSPELDVKIVAFLDDDPSLRGKEPEGIKVLGSTEILPQLAGKLEIDEVIIAIPSAEGPVIRRLLRLCREAQLPFKLIPGIRKIIKGEAHFNQLRAVNLEDLLGRETVDMVEAPVKALLEAKRVLITGAGGSIGGEISRQVAAMQPDHLVLLGRGENSIFEIENELHDLFPSVKIESIIADIRDRKSLIRIALQLQPQVIYHAAAHKHVPFMERFPREAYLNNIRGTLNIIEMAKVSKASHMVMLSTDKAVHPINVMGASKRVAELLMLKAHETNAGTRFLSVRFGNVLGSRGSVVSLFQDQIQRGGPITVTDANATRFFMTIREASMLVIQASSLSQGGEIFILNMGERIEIIELARSLIILYGYEPDRDIHVEFTHLRPGEKLHEELMTSVEVEVSELGKEIKILRPSIPDNLDLDSFLGKMDQLADEGKDDEIAQGLLSFVNKLERLN
jgi:FlaA1/EpsC-like NDP-sugar epimerase